MDDAFDEQMLMMVQSRNRGGAGRAGGDRRPVLQLQTAVSPPSLELEVQTTGSQMSPRMMFERAEHEMSLADMKGADMKSGLAKLREELSDIEVDEYRDFFDLVDEDKSNSIDADELKQVMVMMGMEAPEEQIKAMIGEVKDASQPMEMDFDEFLTLMAIFVGPRGDQQQKELEEAFNAIDEDGGGSIDMEELGGAFKKYGERVSQEELDGIVKIVDADGDGEIDLDEFKTIMMTAVPKDADDTERVLRRKMRSTVRALIMQHRMKDAFAGFNARYDFLRFTDAKIIAPDNQMIVRLHVDQTTMDASRAMRDADELFSPVYEDADKKESPIGFVDMMDIVHLMLGAVKNAFLMKTSDTVAVQMRLERVTESAGQFANTKCGSICDNKWNAIRPGYCVNDVGMVLQRGATRVPYVGDDGDLKYVISQLSFVCAFNDDPRIRLGGVGHVTAADLGGIKHLRTVTQNTQLMEAFEMLSEAVLSSMEGFAAGTPRGQFGRGHYLPSGACPVVDSESGAIIWYVSPDTLKVAGDTSKELAIALSKPIADLYETVQSKETLKPPVTISPNTNMTEMVKLIAETKAHRLWVCDDAKRPIGVVSLTNMIQCIMKSEE